MYRTLVSSDKVPVWSEKSISGIAYHEHLYTSLVAGIESDSIERWLDHEFESPAAGPLRKATSDQSLTADEWTRIHRFVAAQDVRTPVRLIEGLKRWQEAFPDLLSKTLKESVKSLEEAKQSGVPITARPTLLAQDLPLRVTSSIEPGASEGIIKAEAVVGRGLWLFGIKVLLTRTLNVLHEHRWTVLKAPSEIDWLTSDDPVIRLNYSDSQRYDFGGGWGSPGTEIFLPIGPKHLLYAKVGSRPPSRGTMLSVQAAEDIQRLIAEHGHRTIFSKKPDSRVDVWRPRQVNAGMVKEESENWQKWHDEQVIAEQELGKTRSES